MQKVLQKLLLIVAMMLVPWVTQAQGFNYSCGFDNDSDTAGWTFVNGSQSNTWVIGTATNNGGTKSLYVSNDNGTSNNYDASSATFAYACLNLHFDEAGSYVVSYDWKCQGESNYDYVRVFLAPASQSLNAGQDPSGGTSQYSWASAAFPTGCISLMGSGVNKLNLQSSWQNVFIDFAITDTGAYKLVFAWANDGSVGNAPAGAIDNVLVSQPTCPRPNPLTFTNVDAHAFDVSWTEVGSSTEWLVRLSRAGSIVSAYSVTDTTVSFTALSSNTYYQVSVASICGVSDTSPWRTATIHTYCDMMDSLPYVMDFETATAGSSNSRDFGADCWARLDDGTDYFYPYIYNYSSYNHTPGGSIALYWYNASSSSNYGTYDCIIMPGVDTTVYPMSSLLVSFWAKPSGTYYPVLQVGVMSDPTDMSTFELVQTVSVSSVQEWQEFLIPLENYTGDGRFIAFKSVAGNYWYMYMDDIKLEVAPDCPRVENIVVSNISPNSATVSWSERGGATSWEISYLANGMPSDSTVTMTVTDSTVNLTGLYDNTRYTVQVVPVCDSGLAGINSTAFKTHCNDFDSLPYFYSFEDGPAGDSYNPDLGVDCWFRMSNASQYYYPYVASSSTYAHTGNRGLYCYNYYYSGGGYASFMGVVLPKFDSVLYPLNTRKVLGLGGLGLVPAYNPRGCGH